MSRPLRSALICLCALAALAVLASLVVGPEAIRTGQSLYEHRVKLEAALVPGQTSLPLVVWLGDSTMMEYEGHSYPGFVTQDLAASRPIESRVVTYGDMDFFYYYFVMGEAVRLHPAAVVVVANLRLFQLARLTRTLNDLCSMVQPADLLRTMTLPLHERGITIPKLFLAQVLRTRAGERGLYLFEGLRSMLRRSALLGALMPQPAEFEWARALQDPERGKEAAMEIVHRHWVQGNTLVLSRRQAMVRMMQATVRLAARHGVPVIVVGSPVPWERLAELGYYDEAAYDRRFALLRTVVEDAGGRFVDLHQALRHDELRDIIGHFTDKGARLVARGVEPVLRDVLDAGAPPTGGSR